MFDPMTIAVTWLVLVFFVAFLRAAQIMAEADCDRAEAEGRAAAGRRMAKEWNEKISNPDANPDEWIEGLDREWRE